MLPSLSLSALPALALLASPAAALVTLPNGHQFLGRPHLDARPHADSYIPFARRSIKGVSGRQRRADYATVRCDSLYKWSLCDGADKCTDMGAVAPGTACINGAMDFDPNGSQAASAATPTTDSDASGSSSSSEDSSSSFAAAPTLVVNAAIQKTSAAATSSPSFHPRKHRKSTTSKSRIPHTSTASAPRKQASAAPKVIAAAKQDPVASATSATSTLLSGFATFFYQEGGFGACGHQNPDSAFIVALALARYGTGSNSAPDCGRRLTITNTDNGKTVEAVVADACPGCRSFDSLDLSVATFDAIADQATGVVPISWAFLD